MRRMANRCKLLWPRVHPYTQPTSSQPPHREREDHLVRTNGLVDEESREGKSKPGSPGSQKQAEAAIHRNRRIIIPAPGGRPSHPPTHNTTTTLPWSQYPSPLQSGIKFTTSSHLTPLVPSTSKARLLRIKDIWVVRIPQRVEKKMSFGNRDRAVYSDLNPLDGGQSLYPMSTVSA